MAPEAGGGTAQEGVVPELHGPGTSRPVDNDFYAQLKGHGPDGEPYHLVIKVGDTAARLERTAQTTGMKRRMAGIGWPYREVLGATSRRLRELLERSPDRLVHLCRETPCTDYGDYAVHAPAYGYVAAGTETDLDALVPAPPKPSWAGRAAGRAASACGRSCAVLGLRSCAKFCGTTRKCGPRGCRAGRCTPGEVPAALLRDPNSETESEPEQQRCRAHEVHYQEGGVVYQLATRRCRDRARGDPVRLVTEDAEGRGDCDPVLAAYQRVSQGARNEGVRSTGLLPSRPGDERRCPLVSRARWAGA